MKFGPQRFESALPELWGFPIRKTRARNCRCACGFITTLRLNRYYFQNEMRYVENAKERHFKCEWFHTLPQIW